MLAYIENFATFTAYCFVVRGMEALGASAYATASYVFVVDIFPDNIGSVLVSMLLISVCWFNVMCNIHGRVRNVINLRMCEVTCLHGRFYCSLWSSCFLVSHLNQRRTYILSFLQTNMNTKLESLSITERQIKQQVWFSNWWSVYWNMAGLYKPLQFSLCSQNTYDYVQGREVKFNHKGFERNVKDKLKKEVLITHHSSSFGCPVQFQDNCHCGFHIQRLLNKDCSSHN
jgi:hypothetical protein